MQELQQITVNHSPDAYLKDFMDHYKNCIARPYSFLVNNAKSPSDNPMRFRCDLLERI